MVTVDDIRPRALALPCVTEALVRDRVKFRVGRIVWLAFSRDERTMGFAYPKEQRESLVAGAPGKYLMPGAGDLRYNWVAASLDRLDVSELDELVVEAWSLAVPRRVRDEEYARRGLLT